MADKATQDLERIYTIPLREVKSSPRNHQADRAIRHIKRFLAKHMKTETIWIDASVNEKIWAHGMYTVPSKIRVRARRFDDGVVEVSLPEAETAASIRTAIQERREKAQEGKEKKEEEEEGEEKKEGAKKPKKEGATEEAGKETKPAAPKKEAPGEPTKAAAPKTAAPGKAEAAKPAKPEGTGADKPRAKKGE